MGICISQFYPGGPFMVTNSAFGGNLNNNIAMFAVIGDNNLGIDSDEFFGFAGICISKPSYKLFKCSIPIRIPKFIVNLSIFDQTGKIYIFISTRMAMDLESSI